MTAGVICCMHWNQLNALDYDFMEICHVVTGRKLRESFVQCLLSVYYMPDTVLDTENSMIGTRVSVFRELSVVCGVRGRRRSKHWEIVLISQMSKSLGIAKGIVAELNADLRPLGFLFSQKTHIPGKLEWEPG